MLTNNYDMQRIILFLLCSSVSFGQTTVRKAWGANGFIVETYWPGTFEYLNNAKLRRLYIDNSALCPNSISGDKFYLTDSWQGWPIKNQLIELKKRGIDVIWCTQGSFHNSTLYTDSPPNGAPRLGAKMNILMPLMKKEDDPYLPASYHKLARLCFNIARVYGNNPAGGLSTTEVATTSDVPPWYPADLTGGPEGNGTGLNLVKYMEIQNEWNLSELFGIEGGSVKFDFKSYAICFKACYDAIKLGDPNMRVILGAIYNDGNIQTQKKLMEQLQLVFDGTIPKDIILNWHIYACDPLGGNSPVTSKTMENIKIPANYLDTSVPGIYLDLINKWDLFGHDWMVSEFSWDTSQFTDRSVPILSGITGSPQQRAEKSMGILDVRASLLSMSGKRCIGVLKYILADQQSDPNRPFRFETMGIYNNNNGHYLTGAPGTPKECLPYYNEFMTQMGDCILPLQLIHFSDNEYKVVGQKASGQKVMASWGDNGEIIYQIID